jgi:hypothetical protein
MNRREQIIQFIDRYFHPLLFYEIMHLKTNAAVDLIQRVIDQSGKGIPEATLVSWAAVRCLWRGTGSLDDFIKNNAGSILKMAVEKRGQANLPGRALPLFEVLARKTANSPVSVIELGASAGLIGRCLLNPAQITANRTEYFHPDSQMPDAAHPIARYLGIEHSPPDTQWLLAWEWRPGRRELLKQFIANVQGGKNFKLLQADASGFSTLEEVRDIAARDGVLVVLTSFLLYQYEHDARQRLIKEILEFTARGQRHWLNQAVDETSWEYYIQLDREKIIQLSSDLCTHWKWLT